MKQVLEFDFVLPGLNGKGGLIREHYHAKKKRKDDLYWIIRQAKPKLHGDKVIITYTRASVIAPDWDNLSASFKHWGDCLVDAGVIKDDKPSVVVEFKPRWEKAKNNKSVYTRIEIEDV
ncbi:MAG: hypothetical protein RIE52_12110 [Balneola sp.]